MCDGCPALDSPRIGAWYQSGAVQRSLDGILGAFRIWNIAADGKDVCPTLNSPHLVADFAFGSTLAAGNVLKDLSGQNHDGIIHNAGFTDEPPPWDPSLCDASGGRVDAQLATDVQAWSRFFDGDSDYVKLDWLKEYGRPEFDTVSIEVWVKFFSTQGNHPIMNEDNWDVGDLHYQIYASTFGFDVHPRGGDSGDTGDFTFGWQPSTNEWYFISVVYSSTAGCFSVGAPCIELNVNNELVETSSAANPIHGPPITLDSPRIGAWYVVGRARLITIEQ